MVVGGANTLLSLGVFAGLNALFSDDVGYLGILAVTWAFGIVVSYVAQRLLVFKVRGNVLADFVRFSLVQLTAFGANALLLAAFVERLDAPVVPAQAVALALVVVGTYFTHLNFTFRRSEPSQERDATATTDEPNGNVRRRSTR